MDKAWYQLAHDDVCRQLETDASRGLAADEAERRTERYGPNELVERGGRSPWRILWEQVSGVMTVILLVAAAISIFLQEPIDAVVILAIVVLNAALGFYQEFKAARSMAALKRMSVPRVRTARRRRAGGSPPGSWSPETSCYWRRATWSRPTGGLSAA